MDLFADPALRALQLELHPDADPRSTAPVALELAPPGWRQYVAKLAEGFTYQSTNERDLGLISPFYCSLCDGELDHQGIGHDYTCMTLQARLLLDRHDLMLRLRQAMQHTADVVLPGVDIDAIHRRNA